MFKVFPKYGIDTLQAIIVNYLVCVITGSVFMGEFPFTNTAFHTSWFSWSLLMGVGFILIFNLIGFCTKTVGITTSVIANKLSLVIPAIFSIIVYKESADGAKLLGIVFSLPAVYFTAKVAGEKSKANNLLLPIFLFLGGGLLDTLMNFIQKNFLITQHDQALYSIFCFAVAGGIGFLFMVVQLFVQKRKFQVKNILAGVLIGIPNYFSIYYFIRLLHSTFMQSSSVIPLLNICIVVTSTLAAIIIFKEKSGISRVIGLILSVLSIFLLAV